MTLNIVSSSQEDKQLGWSEERSRVSSSFTFPDASRSSGAKEAFWRVWDRSTYVREERDEDEFERTLFDLASLTSDNNNDCDDAAVEKGMISLNDKVWLLSENFVSIDKRKKMTVHHLLVHSAGYAPDQTPAFEPKYGLSWEHGLSRVETFDCRDRIFKFS